MNTTIVFGIVSLACEVVFVLYIVLSALDLGVCLISLTASNDDTCESILGTIDGIWHANQTWLVILGAALFGGFPTLYSDVLSSLYLPVLGLLVAIIIRGIAIEYRHYATAKRPWRFLAGFGAFAIILCQGIIFAAILTSQTAFTSSSLLWKVVPIVTTSLLSLSLFLGALWLDHTAQGKHLIHRHVLMFLVAGAGVSMTILGLTLRCSIMPAPHVSGGLFAWFLSLTVLAVISAFMLIFSLRTHSLSIPWGLIIAALGLIAFLLSLDPSTLSLADGMSVAATSSNALSFQSTVMVLVLPLLLVFNVFAYRSFGTQVK
ncbi:cytochrome d ubiquinol oxidase subunit II [Desulfovibrio inopinatus]|uniref:cytochrome d ubiquinol oxidase subunit II n=1 Tax=Desulfovibrio inopinatus TaxID=102109 RepID=UPI0003FE2A06|nr:cytochrome d ubiquinol oxidase subunit II [Desulfovibrio inopinatus]